VDRAGSHSGPGRQLADGQLAGDRVSMLMPGTVNPGPYCKFKPPGSGAARFQCLLAKMSRTSRAA
jgi:hypothetical protein